MRKNKGVFFGFSALTARRTLAFIEPSINLKERPMTLKEPSISLNEPSLNFKDKFSACHALTPYIA